MIRYDVLVAPGLRCEPARTAQRAWHDYVKNTFQFLRDDDLLDWIQTEGNVAAFRECATQLLAGLDSFSGAVVIDRLGPFSSLPVERRAYMRHILDDAFRAGFQPDAVRERLKRALAPVLRGLDDLQTKADTVPNRVAALAALRKAAAALRADLEALPKGFWLPRPGADMPLRGSE